MVVDNRVNSGWAIASLVLGIASLILIWVFIGVITAILAIVFGIIALVDIKNKNKKGKGMAIAGIILGVISIIIIVIAVIALGFIINSQLSGAEDAFSRAASQVEQANVQP